MGFIISQATCSWRKFKGGKCHLELGEALANERPRVHARHPQGYWAKVSKRLLLVANSTR